ncbi:hypothetical protein AMTRI_Chr05g62070 [Amborella trichopoda]
MILHSVTLRQRKELACDMDLGGLRSLRYINGYYPLGSLCCGPALCCPSACTVGVRGRGCDSLCSRCISEDSSTPNHNISSLAYGDALDFEEDEAIHHNITIHTDKDELQDGGSVLLCSSPPHQNEATNIINHIITNLLSGNEVAAQTSSSFHITNKFSGNSSAKDNNNLRLSRTPNLYQRRTELVHLDNIPSNCNVPSEQLVCVSNGGPTEKVNETTIINCTDTVRNNSEWQDIDKDFSRMHIFCLEHATEVGHYPKIEEKTKTIAEEMGVIHSWNGIVTALEDLERLRVVLEEEDDETSHGNGDWAIKLGVNLYHTSNLLVAGKWCGKVWIVNQVHPYLTNGKLSCTEHVIFSTSIHHQSNILKNTLFCSLLKSPRTKGKQGERNLKPNQAQKSREEVSEPDEAGTSRDNDPEVVKASAAGFEGIDLASEEHDEIGKEGETPRSGMKKWNQLGSGPPKPQPVRNDETEVPYKRCVRKKRSKKIPESGNKEERETKRMHTNPDGFSMGIGTKQEATQVPLKGCKMTFKWAWARTKHIRVHTGDRLYVCKDNGRGRTFRFVSDFSHHKRKTRYFGK